MVGNTIEVIINDYKVKAEVLCKGYYCGTLGCP